MQAANREPRMIPKAQARQVIDERLQAAGRRVRGYARLDLGAAMDIIETKHEQHPQSQWPRRSAISKASA